MPPNGKMLQIPVQDSRASHAREACDKKLPTKRNSNYKKTNTMTRRPVRMLFNSQCQILVQHSDRVGRKRRLCSLAKLEKKQVEKSTKEAMSVKWHENRKTLRTTHRPMHEHIVVACQTQGQRTTESRAREYAERSTRENSKFCLTEFRVRAKSGIPVKCNRTRQEKG
jgi:hypothetical protein